MQAKIEKSCKDLVDELGVPHVERFGGRDVRHYQIIFGKCRQTVGAVRFKLRVVDQNHPLFTVLERHALDFLLLKRPLK